MFALHRSATTQKNQYIVNKKHHEYNRQLTSELTWQFSAAVFFSKRKKLCDSRKNFAFMVIPMYKQIFSKAKILRLSLSIFTEWRRKVARFFYEGNFWLTNKFILRISHYTVKSFSESQDSMNFSYRSCSNVVEKWTN